MVIIMNHYRQTMVFDFNYLELSMNFEYQELEIQQMTLTNGDKPPVKDTAITTA